MLTSRLGASRRLAQQANGLATPVSPLAFDRDVADIHCPYSLTAGKALS